MTKGFRVDPDKLADVADRVKALHADVGGGSGNWAGNQPNFQESAKGDGLQTGLAEIWPDWNDGFARGYSYEYKGILQTYDTMKQQLANLESACRTTATQYGKKDDDSKADVNATDNQEL